MYARNLVCCYASKVSDLSNGILHAIDQSNFLLYAACGRAIIENTATLRYYLFDRYKPLLDKGTLTPDDKRALIEIDDQHLLGGRFDWESFLFKRYAKLRADALERLRDKKRKKTPKLAETNLPKQVNAQACVDKWAEETPTVAIAYDLFCDLVHPNIGSNFLIASTSDTKLYFSRFRGEPVGKDIFAQSFPILMSVGLKSFSKYLGMLMFTIWQDDEL